jgi:hypothetical protein
VKGGGGIVKHNSFIAEMMTQEAIKNKGTLSACLFASWAEILMIRSFGSLTSLCGTVISFFHP